MYNIRILIEILSSFSLDEASLSATKVLTCWDPTRTGLGCDVPNTPCDLRQPCQNDGTCHNVDAYPGYNCSCAVGFQGPQCELDRRPCRENTCWNGGRCSSLLNETIGIEFFF